MRGRRKERKRECVCEKDERTMREKERDEREETERTCDMRGQQVNALAAHRALCLEEGFPHQRHRVAPRRTRQLEHEAHRL